MGDELSQQAHPDVKNLDNNQVRSFCGQLEKKTNTRLINTYLTKHVTLHQGELKWYSIDKVKVEKNMGKGKKVIIRDQILYDNLSGGDFPMIDKSTQPNGQLNFNLVEAKVVKTSPCEFMIEFEKADTTYNFRAPDPT